MVRQTDNPRVPIPRRIGARFRRAFITGILVMTPLVGTIWILYGLFDKVDGLLGALITRFLGRPVPGLGLMLLVLLVFATGIFARNFIGRRMIRLSNRVLYRIPLFNRIYIALKQIFEVFLGERTTIFQRVVLFEYPRKGVYAIGFVTSESGGEIQQRTARTMINVFLPTTPNPTSGFLLFLAEEDLIPLDMSVEEGIKLVISGGAVTPDTIPVAGSGRGSVSGRSGEGALPSEETDGGPAA